MTDRKRGLGPITPSVPGFVVCQSGVWTSGAQFNPKLYTTVSGNSGTIGPYNWCFLMDTTVTDSSAFGTSGVTLVADNGPGNRYFNAYNSHAGATNPVTVACF